MGACEDTATRACKLGHLLDVCSLLMSMIRLGRRTSVSARVDVDDASTSVYRYFCQQYRLKKEKCFRVQKASQASADAEEGKVGSFVTWPDLYKSLTLARSRLHSAAMKPIYNIASQNATDYAVRFPSRSNRCGR